MITKINKLINAFYKYSGADAINEIRNFMEFKFPQEVWGPAMETDPPPEYGTVGGKFVFEIKPGNIFSVTGDATGSGNLDAWAKKAFQKFGGTKKLEELFHNWAQMHNTEAPFRDVATTSTEFK